MALSQFELGWLVGILEGEGYFRHSKGSQEVRIRMTDEDSICRYIDVIEKLTGHRYELRAISGAQEGWQQAYEVGIHGKNARVIMQAVVPYMSKRRKQRIWQALNGFVPAKRDLFSLIKLAPASDGAERGDGQSSTPAARPPTFPSELLPQPRLRRA